MKLIKFLEKLISVRLDFNVAKKCDVIIFGHGQPDSILMNGLDEFIFCKLKPFYVEINVFIYLMSLMNFRTNKIYYYYKYIEVARPKVVITYIDNSVDFYLLENYFQNSEVKFIAVQNGWRSIKDDLEEINNYDSKGLLCHKGIYMSFSEEIGKTLFPKRKIVGIGSIKNNEVGIIRGSRDIDVVYVSQYQPRRSEELLGYLKKSELNSLSAEYLVITTLMKWCFTNNIQLSILLRSKSCSEQEILFYSSFCNDNVKYLPRTSDLSNYRVIDRAKMLVTVDSTMGYESLSRGCKTVFLSVRNSFMSLRSSDLVFGFPLEILSDGPFWTSDPDSERMLKILNKIHSLSDFEWKVLAYEYRDLFITYSENNILYKNKMKEILHTKIGNKVADI